MRGPLRSYLSGSLSRADIHSMLYPVAHVVGHDNAPLPRRVWHKGKAALRVGAAILKFHLGVSGAIHLNLGVGRHLAARIGKLHKGHRALQGVGRVQGVGVGLRRPQKQQGCKNEAGHAACVQRVHQTILGSNSCVKKPHRRGRPALPARSFSQFCQPVLPASSACWLPDYFTGNTKVARRWCSSASAPGVFSTTVVRSIHRAGASTVKDALPWASVWALNL